MQQLKVKALAVTGPTAVGKTAFAIALAKAYNGEIISCDSMQIYRGMDVGTAKATHVEQSEAPHHMLDICNPEEPYSAADYAKEAYRIARDIAARGRLPIFCGGTGLYLEAVRTGRHETEGHADDAYRESLLRLAEEKGSEVLHAQLAEVDAQAAAAIHPNNVKRVIRALEIYHVTGKTKTEQDKESVEREPQMELCTFCLTFHNRERLYQRIDARVEAMMAEGLLDEARALYGAPMSQTARQAIGYKELFAVFDGEDTLEGAKEKIKLASRRYAKRQLTWFLAKPHTLLYRDKGEELVSTEALLEEAAPIIEAFI